MNRSYVSCRRQIHLLALVGLVMVFSPVAEAQVALASTIGPGPLIHVSMVQSSGTLRVTGDGFSPGGRVYVTLHDPWGQQLDENHWVTASATVYRVDGTGYGFIQGGAIDVTFGPPATVDAGKGAEETAHGHTQGNRAYEMSSDLCGVALMMRAYDAQTDLWSNMLDVAPDC